MARRRGLGQRLAVLVLLWPAGSLAAPADELVRAAGGGSLTEVHQLLAAGAAVTAVNGAQADGGTALMAAAQNGHRPIVQALLARGAHPNAQARDGVTALMLASVQGHGAVVQALLAQGAQ